MEGHFNACTKEVTPTHAKIENNTTRTTFLPFIHYHFGGLSGHPSSGTRVFNSITHKHFRQIPAVLNGHLLQILSLACEDAVRLPVITAVNPLAMFLALLTGLMQQPFNFISGLDRVCQCLPTVTRFVFPSRIYPM